jgi:predicted transglutaminase-like cysteine proteinase
MKVYLHKTKLAKKRLIPFMLSALVCLVFAQVPLNLISPELLALAKKTYGEGIERQLNSWGELVGGSRQVKDLEKLRQINTYFNKKITFTSDAQHWNQEDYWATPLESLGTKAGDCEDFVIAKYFSLIQAGVQEVKLRIMYVKALKLNQAHMVLAYYESPRSVPLILDNLTSKILPASKRRDLSPVYSFNGLGMWLERMKGSSIRIGDPNRLNMWMDLLLRMDKQKMAPWLQLPKLGR